MRAVAMNLRALSAPFAGVQRYTSELLSRWNESVDGIAPVRPLRGISGHAWEQMVLPSRLRGRFLFSPSNTGPLQIANQVVVIHDMSVFDFPGGFSRQFVTWYRFLLPRLVHRVKTIIAVSHFTKARLMALTGAAENKIVVIPNGVGSQFRPDAYAKSPQLVKKLSLPTEKYLLAVGSIEPRKNIVRLLQAWDLALKSLPGDVWLIITGARGDTAVFKDAQLGALADRVFLTGPVSEELLPVLFSGATAVAYPSMYEGFGLPALEAMASGTPVIASNRASLPEIVQDAGLLVDATDVRDIAEGICKIVGDSALRQNLTQKGLLRAKQFSWEETSRQVWEVIQQAISRTT